MCDAPYTEEEWEKIEKLSSEKGKSFSGIVQAKRYLEEICE